MTNLARNRVGELLETLARSYRTFSNQNGKPLLCWQIDPGDEEMVAAFLRHQQSEGELPDLFVEIKVPFTGNGDAYAAYLIADLVRQYEDAAAALDSEEDEALGWTPPEPDPELSQTGNMIRTFETFQQHYQQMAHTLGVLLQPSVIADGGAFARWIKTLLGHHPPDSLRFIVLDPIAAPLLTELIEAEPDRIHAEPLRFDYPGLLEELAKGTADPETPDAQFRVLFVRLSNKAKEKDINGVEEVAQQALALAAAQEWFQMRVAVHSVLGASYLQVQDFDAALGAYRAATGVARKATDAGDPAGPKMVVQSLFAEASTLFAMKQYMQAKETYVEAAPLAEAADDPFLTMEAWRMAAYCAELKKEYTAAADHGCRALEAGEKLPEDQRAQSTLPYVGDSLIRAIKAAKKKIPLFTSPADLPDEAEVRDKMAALLGEDWQESIVTDSQEA